MTDDRAAVKSTSTFSSLQGFKRTVFNCIFKYLNQKLRHCKINLQECHIINTKLITVNSRWPGYNLLSKESHYNHLLDCHILL